MILEFLKPFGKWEVGAITDEVLEGTGRALITEGTAKESNEGAQMRALLKSETDRTRTELLELTRTTLQGQKTATAGPPGGAEVGGTLEHVASPADRSLDGQERARSFGEFCQCVALAQGVDVDQPIRAHATSVLRDRYGAEKCQYKINEKNGAIEQTITRTLNYGVETITRTGTESLGGGPTYGFALKPEYMATLFEIPMEQSVFAEATFGVPMGNALELRWPAMDQYQAPTTVNGIKQSAIFAGFKIVDLTGFTDMSRDLLSDNYIAMDAMATRVFGRAFTWMEDYMGINGTGQGQPEGFLNSKALLGYDRGTASHIYYGDLVNMEQLLHPACWMGARWIAHITTLTELQAIQVSAGVYVYQPNALISQAMAPSVANQFTSGGDKVFRAMGSMLGFPVYFTEKVSTLGNTGDLSLVCPDQYGYARRAGLEVGLSEHFFFSTDRIAFRFKKRHDGKSLWRAPYQQADGTTTVSPFVTLLVHT